VRVRRAEQAERDLIEIWTYIAEENAGAADRLVAEFEKQSRTLADLPYRGKARPDIAADARCLVVGNYLILYHVVGDEVEIVRYVHGRRNLAGIGLEDK
jgi:toxin ParE1/3/4